MSERYCHTLIPTPGNFRPSAVQVRDFFAAIVELGAVGGEPTVVMRTPSDRKRVGMNPFTRKVESYPIKDRAELLNVSAISAAIADKETYEVEVSATGRPQNPPLQIDFVNPYHLEITCRASAELCCTSDQHDELDGAPTLPFYGKTLAEPSKVGLFVNPHSGERITVPDAGCAHFWIEFALGKFLFPKFEQNDLEILNPLIVDEAVGIFGVRFVQGCYWC